MAPIEAPAWPGWCWIFLQSNNTSYCHCDNYLDHFWSWQDRKVEWHSSDLIEQQNQTNTAQLPTVCIIEKVFSSSSPREPLLLCCSEQIKIREILSSDIFWNMRIISPATLVTWYCKCQADHVHNNLPDSVLTVVNYKIWPATIWSALLGQEY